MRYANLLAKSERNSDNWRKYATKMHDEEELMLLKGDVIYDGMACRTMNDVTADCQSAKYEEKNKREPDGRRTGQRI